MTARTFSVSDFGNVVETSGGDASGFNLNNVAFRRDLLLAHPLDARVRRNGGCYFLYHDLRLRGVKIVYEPRAVVAHGLDVGGMGFVRKHFDRGYDGTNVYRLDERGVLRGTMVYRRLGEVGLVALGGRRSCSTGYESSATDGSWASASRQSRTYAVIVLMIRVIELAGGPTAAIRPATTGRERPSHP